MKKPPRRSKPVRYSTVALTVSAMTLSVITLVAVYFKFDGVIQIKLGMDGGQVLIDGRGQSTDIYQ